jgi:hypothetical protein
MSEINVAVELGTLFINNLSKLLKTGQTIKYHDGDDGDLELGVAHDYAVLNIVAVQILLSMVKQLLCQTNACRTIRRA